MTKIVHDGKVIFILSEAEGLEYQALKRETGREEQWFRADIARYLGISMQRLSERRWDLPFHGEGLWHRRNVSWPRSVVEEWLKIPADERRDQYYARFGNVNHKVIHRGS